ncbi:MAG: hypothetical protein JW712_13630 [Dehalococcoidales bacterium]|nr:hypothetical protein [Dehalococcoidales bacterium]
MNYTSLVMKTTIKNNLRRRTVAYIIFGIILICVVGVTFLFVLQFLSPELDKPSPDTAVLKNILGLVLFITSFCSVGIYSSVYAVQSLVREKT